jgi:hypothetical protein
MAKKPVQLLRPAEQACSGDRKQALAAIIARLKELRPRAAERTFFERHTYPDGRVQDFFEETVAINGLRIEYIPDLNEGVYFAVSFEKRLVMTGYYKTDSPLRAESLATEVPFSDSAPSVFKIDTIRTALNEYLPNVHVMRWQRGPWQALLF